MFGTRTSTWGRLLFALAVSLTAVSGCSQGHSAPDSLDADQAAVALSGVRLARIDGVESGTTWLQVAQDGTFRATGYLSGSLDQNATTYFVQLQVPEQVGPMEILHVMPLIVDSDTTLLYDGEPADAAELLDWQPDEWIDVEFSLRGQQIHADALAYTGREREWGAWPDGYPPSAALWYEQLALDASQPPGPGDIWLDVAQSGEPFMLSGYPQGSLRSSPPERGYLGSVDFAVPDRLGDAAVYHLVQIFYTQESDMLQTAVLGAEPKTRTVTVSLGDGRLLATD